MTKILMGGTRGLRPWFRGAVADEMLPTAGIRQGRAFAGRKSDVMHDTTSMYCSADGSYSQPAG